jgi:hypothetical protein
MELWTRPAKTGPVLELNAVIDCGCENNPVIGKVDFGLNAIGEGEEKGFIMPHAVVRPELTGALVVDEPKQV